MAGRTRIGPLASAERWLNNAVNEAGEATNAGEAYVKAKYVFDRLPAPAKTQDKFKTLAEMKERVRQERGQFFGALLQNRQYDGSGKQIKAKKKK